MTERELASIRTKIQQLSAKHLKELAEGVSSLADIEPGTVWTEHHWTFSLRMCQLVGVIE